MKDQSMSSSTFSGIGVVREKESMAKHTTWRAGGPAALYYEPQSRQGLARFLSQKDDDFPIFWLGLGSNLLVRDGGLDALVIATKANLLQMKWIDKDYLYAESGVPCPKLAKEVAKQDYAGLEFLAGIPGTLGGALSMNAGALGSEIWSHIRSVDTMDLSGQITNKL